MKRPIQGAALTLLVAVIAIQFVPKGRDHTNPPITGSPEWSSPQVEALARRACFDCHSNETRWPWYASIAPLSWRIEEHVTEGRSKLNFSEFDRPQRDAHEAAEEVEKGEMPLSDYLRFHPEARLTDAEKTELVAGFQAMFGGHRGEHGDEGEHEDEHGDDAHEDGD